MQNLLRLREDWSTWLLLNTFMIAAGQSRGIQSHLEQQVAFPKSRTSFCSVLTQRRTTLCLRRDTGIEVPVIPAGTEFNTRLHRPEL